MSLQELVFPKSPGDATSLELQELEALIHSAVQLRSSTVGALQGHIHP